MHVGRTLPPAAAPIGIAEFVSGISGILRGDKELERFQSSLKQHFGVKHCFLVSSGKAAFTVLLLALKELFPGRDEVLIPAFTCFSAPSSVVRAGLKIRLCDLRSGSLDFDIELLSAVLAKAARPRPADTRSTTGKVGHLPGEFSGLADVFGSSTGRLLAVVPTHLFGFPSEVHRLRRLIEDPGVTIVEDAAQAMGETSQGKNLGTLGDIGFFSLGRGKAYSTVEGGVILTDRDDVAEALSRRLRDLPGYGLWQLMSLIAKTAGLMLLTHPMLFWIPRSMPFLRLGETLFDPHFPMLRMSSFQAGLARNWRARIETFRAARRKNADRWISILEKSGIRSPATFGGQSPALLRFPITLSDKSKRDSLLRESGRRGMGIMPVYPASINAIPELKGKVEGGAFPVAERCALELVTLPTHGYLTENDMTQLAGLVSRVMGLG